MRLQGKGDWQEPGSEEQAAVQDLESDDVDTPTQAEHVKVPEVPTFTGPGHRLQVAREAMNLTQEEVAARLRLTRQTIQFIDKDNYTLPTPKTFLRGYLRAYAKLVEVSPDEIVAAFEQIPMQEQAMQVQLPSPATRQTWRKRESSMRWFLYVVASIAVVVVALGFQWWHSYNKVVPSDTTDKSVQQSSNTEIVPGQLVRPAAVTSSVVVTPVTPTVTTATTATPAANAPTDAQVPVALELKFTGPVTLKLADRDGKVLHEGKYDRNDHVSYDQVAAYEILVDQPDNVAVRFHGRLLMPVRYPGEEYARIILQ